MIRGDEIGVVYAIGVIKRYRISATFIRGHGKDETADGRALGKGDSLMAGELTPAADEVDVGLCVVL